MQRHSYPPDRSPLGEGWVLPCPDCGRSLPSGPRGLCQVCGGALIETLPSVRDEAEVPAPYATRTSLLGLLTLPMWAPFLALWAESGSLLGTFLVFFFANLFFFPVSIGYFLLVRAIYRRFHPAESQGRREIGSFGKLEAARVELTELRARRGLMVHLDLRCRDLVGESIQVEVRFRGPDGHYLASGLRRYQGPRAEALIRWESPPVKNYHASFPKVWLFCPIRAFLLPPGIQRVVGAVEVLVGGKGQVFAEADLPFAFLTTDSDFAVLPGARPRALLGPAPGAREDEFQVLASEGGDKKAQCGVCGDPLETRITTSCSLCDTSYHRDCWDYLGGCATYACEGRPSDPSPNL